MKTKQSQTRGAVSVAAMAALCCSLSIDITNAASVYDLRTDWSDTTNPNGVWSYNQGTTPLPHVSNWALDGFSSSQGGWAIGSTLPFWFLSSATPLFTHDWQLGDVIVHTQDDVNGGGHGVANVTWTSPITGAIDIAGGLWMGRDNGRANHWSLFVNGTLISQSDISSGDPFSRANPFDLAMGSGGTNALDDILVRLGDVVMLQLTRTTFFGDYVGVNLTITEHQAPRLRIRVSQVELCWDTLPDVFYELQFSSTLTTNQWTPFATNLVRGTGTDFCTNDIVILGQPQRYYRVVVTNGPPQL